MPRVTFKPFDADAQVPPGTSLLEAASAAGVSIRNHCGGRGACGRCIVRVQSGEVTRLSSRFELQEGEQLACRTLTLESDVSVFVPETSREVGAEVSIREAEALPAEFPPPGALLRRKRVEIPEPSLEDNVSDHHRLLDVLQQWRQGRYEVPLSLLQDMPPSLREAGWKPWVTLSVGPEESTVLEVDREGAHPRCMVAVDVGTTALKAHLLAGGSRWMASCYNSQGAHGPDVITRIIYCQQNEDGRRRMQQLVVGDINRLIGALLEAAELPREDVGLVVASGNTTMMHLLLGLHPLWIRREPYVGCSYNPPPVPAGEVGINIHRRGRLFALPSVSSYVGADITAGVLATGLCEQEQPGMLIDLGTNGEIVIGCREFLICCSASAGPAFEGEASASGTRAMPGAIDALWWEDGIRWCTIDGDPPVGICGSGYIDLLAVLAARGVVDRTGRLQPGSSEALRPADQEEEQLEYVLVPGREAVGGQEIVLTQTDVNNLVRAKGAIYAAASLMVQQLGLEWSSLQEVMLAGGFGETIDKENAVRIGLLPDVPREKIEFVGNTSLQGAVRAALSTQDCERVQQIARRMTYMELSTHPDYMNEFVAACFLPHTDTEKFPSVEAEHGADRNPLNGGR